MPNSIEEEATAAIQELEEPKEEVKKEETKEESVLTEEEQILNDLYLKDYIIPEEENAS